MLHKRRVWPVAGHQQLPRPEGRGEAVGVWENEGGSLPRPRRQAAAYRAPDNTAWGRDGEMQLALFDALPVGVLITNEDGEINYSNRAGQKMLAVEASELLGAHWRQFIDVRDRAQIPERCQDSNGKSGQRFFEARLVAGRGCRTWVRYCIAVLDLGEAGVRHVHTIEDISSIKAAEQVGKAAFDALSRAGESARMALEGVGDAVISTDLNGRVSYLNPVAETLTGWSRQEACGKRFKQVFRLIDSSTGRPAPDSDADPMPCSDIIQPAVNGLLLRPDASELAIEQSVFPIRDVAGRLMGAVVIFRDRRLSTECMTRMAHLACHDELTGLSNRVALSEHFEQALNLARRHHKRVGLLFIDLDNFKHVNDTLGHEAGDRVLRTFSSRVIRCVRSTDLVCRYGGDEFVVLLSEIGQAEDAAKVAGLIYQAAGKAVRYRGHDIDLQLSIGISLYPDHGEDADVLLHRADAAMYQAKLEGGQQHCLYQPSMASPVAGVQAESVANVSQRTDSHGANGR